MLPEFQAPFVCSAAYKSNGICNRPSWEQGGLREGQEHIPSPQAEMTGNVGGQGGGKAGDQPAFLAGRCWRQDGPVASFPFQNIHANLCLSTHVFLVLVLISDQTCLSSCLSGAWWGTALMSHGSGSQMGIAGTPVSLSYSFYSSKDVKRSWK